MRACGRPHQNKGRRLVAGPLRGRENERPSSVPPENPKPPEELFRPSADHTDRSHPCDVCTYHMYCSLPCL